MNRLQQQEPNQLIHQWQNELSQRGYIDNEGGILNLFQKMDLQKEEDRLIASQLLTMVALSISKKVDRILLSTHGWKRLSN